MTPEKIETLLQTRRFTIQRWTFQRDAGARIEREVVVHPGAVVVLPLLSDTEIVMIHNLRHVAGGELMELPAGTLEHGESPAACAGRELEEETGYRARRIESLGEFYTSPGICTELMHAFLARDLTRTEQALDAGEHIRVEIVGLDCALQMVAAGRIRDGKTIAALATYRLQQGKL